MGFYLIFYVIPLFILPFFLDEYDFLCPTGIHAFRAQADDISNYNLMIPDELSEDTLNVFPFSFIFR